MSPASVVAGGDTTSLSPLCTSTPFAKAMANGHDAADGVAHADLINGNVNVNIVSESNYSIDVLSGGESEAGDTLRRENNNNSISSNLTNTLREGTLDAAAARGADLGYFIAKELLMTERTYKRDLELVTVTWSGYVSQLAGDASGGGSEAAAALARACLALEPLALACGALLARLERALAPHRGAADDEPEYRKVPELLHDYLLSSYDAYQHYIENAGPLVGLVENVRRSQAGARAASAAFEAAAPLPLAALLLRPLHRARHYRALAAELCASSGSDRAQAALEVAERLWAAARCNLPPAENHAALCQLQRDVAGYDKLLVANREFIRLGCVYKHSTKGLQQRMLFLFSDVAVVCARAGSQFRAAAALPLRGLALRDAGDALPHSFQIESENVHLLFSASNEAEYLGWKSALSEAIEAARDNPSEVDTELTPVEQDTDGAAAVPGAACMGALSQVCWHRAASLSRAALHHALQSQQSGYLLRKFKKSVGWQRLWVVWAVRALHFYKTWRDAAPLALLPLLGYSVSAPSPSDGIDKEFVFKLQFKNHVYFFRADSNYTYNRWIEVLQPPTENYDYDE